MELAITDISNPESKKGNVTVDNNVYACEYNEALIHQIVTTYLSGARAGTKAQKTRGECRGGGRKPFRQKGTGRARAGTIRSPIWIGGGKTFAAKPRDFSAKINKKMYRKGMSSILSELVRQERLVVVDDSSVELPEAKTKLLVEKITSLGINKDRVLIVVSAAEDNLALASRNLINVDVAGVKEVNPVELVKTEKMIITKSAVVQLQERFA